MTNTTSNEDPNEKPEIKKVQYNIDGLEHNFDQEQEYNESIHKEEDAIQIIFENGAKVRYRKTENGEIIEETFQSNSPHSVYDSMNIPASDLVKAVEVTVEEYNQDTRKTEEDFNDWELLQEVIF